MTASLAVMPVLVGPLQVLLALLPAILAAVGGAILAVFKPSGFKKLVRFFWHQKLFTACLILIGVALWQGYPQRLWTGSRRGGAVSEEARRATWPMLRGGPERTGHAGGDDPTDPTPIWTWNGHPTVYSSPTIAGDRVYFSTVADISPFSPEGKGAVVCIEAETGKELWRYAPADFRATFSAPVVAEERIVFGEGLHITTDARVTCLDLTGKKIWDFRTESHVEATPCIHSGRAYISAGDDGFYCVALEPNRDGKANILWHLPGNRYPDCESSPVCDGETVWFGLGEDGHAVVAVDAVTGQERWRTKTPHPVFTSPTLAGGKLYVGVGNGNFIMSAEEIRQQKLAEMREEGRPPHELDAAFRKLAPYGAVWSLDAATGDIVWKYGLKETVLDAIACRDGRLYFGCRDGDFQSLTTDGRPVAKWNAGAPILASAAAGKDHVYIATNAGRLFCLRSDTLQPAWETALQKAQGTLSSSPTLAHGHVYVGTEAEGLKCIGTTEPPEPEIWTREGFGDPTESAIPAEMEVAWTFPEETGTKDPAERASLSYGALMPFGDSIYCLSSTESEAGSSISRVRNNGDVRPELVWRVPCIPGRRALCGSGDSILCVSDLSSSQSRTILCIESANGATRWKHGYSRNARPDDEANVFVAKIHNDLAGAGFSVDAERFYVWSDRSNLLSLDLKTGQEIWRFDIRSQKQLFPDASSESQPGLGPLEVVLGSGSPRIFDGVLYVQTTAFIAALDPPTGRVLWAHWTEPGRSNLSSLSRSGPEFCSGALIVPSASTIECRELTDGSRRWKSPDADESPHSAAVIATGASFLLHQMPHGGWNCVDASIGTIVWSFDNRELNALTTGSFCLVGDQLLLIDQSRLRILQLGPEKPANLFVEGMFPPPKACLSAWNGRLIYVSDDRRIVCLRGVRP